MTPTTIDIAAILNSAKVVKKVWGWEAELVNTELYCAKLMKLTAGYQCSLHCHTVKDETFLVIEGRVRLERDDFVHYLSPGDKLRINPGSFHRFSSTEGALILEVSMHHNDEDVTRKEESKQI